MADNIIIKKGVRLGNGRHHRSNHSLLPRPLPPSYTTSLHVSTKSRKTTFVDDFKVFELWARCQERKHERAHFAAVKRLPAVLADAGLNAQAPQPDEGIHQCKQRDVHDRRDQTSEGKRYRERVST